MVGLEYTTGSPADYPNLPNLKLNLGQSCKGTNLSSVDITLTPTQYSYKVDVGDRAGKWVIAMQRLDGIGGLLVGSTSLDLIYSSYRYIDSGTQLTQGDMYIYEKKNFGPSVAFACQALTRHPPRAGR